MDYTHRTIEKILFKISNQFPAILITGARQVGKTTLLKYANKSEKTYISLDDPDLRLLANEEPSLFFKRYSPPMIIDEIQYAPKLLPYIKILIDESKSYNLFWLTGSQHFHMMKNISESLAGRVAILNLSGLSVAEINNNGLNQDPFLPVFKDKNLIKNSLNEIYNCIWRGFYPYIALSEDVDWNIFYSSYVQTYIQRDIRDLSQIGDELTFIKFLKVLAARIGQLLNLSEISTEVGISIPTVKRWLSILRASNIIYLLPPWYSNISKRLIKTPKIYFMDTGLAAYLTNWTSSQTLEAGAMSGAFFENFVICEIIKTYIHNGLNPDFYFYRDKDKYEIDLLIFKDNEVYPLEIKKTASPHKRMVKVFSKLEKIGLNVNSGGVICLVDDFVPLTEKYWGIPVASIWN